MGDGTARIKLEGWSEIGSIHTDKRTDTGGYINGAILFKIAIHWVCAVSTVQYCTVLYCTVLYCTVLYCTVLYCTVLYCTVLYCTVLYCTVMYCTSYGYTSICNILSSASSLLQQLYLIDAAMAPGCCSGLNLEKASIFGMSQLVVINH